MRFFTLKELSKSETANRLSIDNTPSLEVIENLTLLVDNILDPLRDAYGKPIIITSGYRSPQLNVAIKGAKTSLHMTGNAADISAGSKEENKKLFNLILDLKLPFDLLIDEKNFLWVHVSYSSRNRRQILHL